MNDTKEKYIWVTNFKCYLSGKKFQIEFDNDKEELSYSDIEWAKKEIEGRYKEVSDLRITFCHRFING